jgi:serine/threonine protein kinase
MTPFAQRNGKFEMWEHYTQIREIPGGGMGSIWLLVDNRTRLPCVGKMMLPDLVRDKDAIRFRREVKALMSLDHANIAKVYEATAPGEQPLGYVMEYCPNGHVGSFAASRDPEHDAWRIVEALIAAVEELHEHG